MTRMLLLAATTLTLAACQAPEQPAKAPEPAPAAAPPAAPAPSDQALTAEGWGPLRIGMTKAEVEAALGPDANPEAVGGPDPEACDEFRPARAPEGLLVMIEAGRLTRISVTQGSTVRTDRNLGVGDQASAVKTAYGPLARPSPHKYVEAPAEYLTVWAKGGGLDYVQDVNARGLVYEIGREGRVQTIHAGGPSIQYVEGCA